MTPRILISAGGSGTGKTTVVISVLQALRNRGVSLMACKSGPDYIDPMFHTRAIGAKSCNLDLFFFDKKTARALLKENAAGCDLTVIEGAMGYYDGIAMSEKASAFDLAQSVGAPVVLVLNGKGKAVTLAAEVLGMKQFRENSMIQGVILNRVSSMVYPRLKETIERETGVNVYGYLPELPECEIGSRHLGLMTASEVEDLEHKLSVLGTQAEKTIDLDGLVALARTAEEITDELPEIEPVSEKKIRVAIAEDDAFCFYYRDSLKLLEKCGAELIPFSPLNDNRLPEDVAGLYLGGGYPEVFAHQLSENHAMKDSIKKAVEQGMPTFAECGGFLYLHRQLEDVDGKNWPMVGVLQAEAFATEKLVRFGYINAEAKEDSLLFEKGVVVPGHEFHYWDSTCPGDGLMIKKPMSDRCWEAAITTKHLYAGFPHFHMWAAPNCAARFVRACKKFAEEKKC